jgi:hypothetical protein
MPPTPRHLKPSRCRGSIPSRARRSQRLLPDPRSSGFANLHPARAELRHALTFEKDVRPILKEHCFRCHGEGEKLKGGVDLRLRRFMEKLSKDGDRIMVPGKPDDSEMVSQIRDGDMPPKSKKLPDEEIATIAQWIAQGAKTARPEPEQVPKYWITEEEREFWAFQPIRRLDPPSVKIAGQRAESHRRLPPRETRGKGPRLQSRSGSQRRSSAA